MSMNTLIKCSASGLLMFSLNGCALDRGLSPEPGGEQVSITVKVPQNLAAEPMQVIYRSAKCPIKRSGPDWSSFEVDGYLTTTVQPLQQGNSNLYETKLAINGGGGCQWQLSNVTFGVTYASTTHFGQNVQSGPGGGIIVMFDDHLPQRRSVFDPTVEVSGDLLIKEDYYPWVSEKSLGGHERLAWLVGEGGVYLYYRAPNARKVLFEPLLHADYVLYSVEPEGNKKGDYNRFTYPDGSAVADGGKPNFKKLQAIRLEQSR